MKQNLTLTSHDLLEYQTFSIFGSKSARNMNLFNTFGIFGEILIVFFLLEIFLEIKFLALIGFIVALLWLMFYPKFLRKKRIKILKKLKDDGMQKQMTLELNESEFSFYEDEPTHKFNYKDVSQICQTAGVYVVFVGNLHIILPKPSAKDSISAIAKLSNKPITTFDNISYQNAISGKI
ncbi:hypothetical protein U5B43_08015 [Campylobacter sp. 9BO]|uniref:hypothetical protein n=1 Tax=Campylobacter sp. 9BO TaxID=3424759 RepID=UPI003D32BC50